MFAAMMNKQNKLQKLWSNWNLFGCFVLSVCANHSAVMVEKNHPSIGCFPYSARYEHLSDAQRLMGAFLMQKIKIRSL